MSNLAQALKKMKYPFKVFTNKDIKTDLKSLQPHFNKLCMDQYLQRKLNLPFDRPMRMRRMMGYNIEFDKLGNITQFHEDYQMDEFDSKENLTFARLYEEFTDEMKNDQAFKNYLYNTLRVCWEVKQMKKATMTCHAIRTISYDGQPAQPTPEGAHRDGVDMEVIACINKQNCQGAESQIFSADKEKIIFEMTLDPSEGYFIDGLNLWHYATDHTPVDPTKPGIRDILGYLLKVDEFHKD